MNVPPPILRIDDLTVTIGAEDSAWRILDGFSLAVPRGQTLALLGESGSGKTLAALAILGLLPSGVRVTSGSIRFGNEELTAAGEKRLREIRGDHVGMIFTGAVHLAQTRSWPWASRSARPSACTGGWAGE